METIVVIDELKKFRRMKSNFYIFIRQIVKYVFFNFIYLIVIVVDDHMMTSEMMTIVEWEKKNFQTDDMLSKLLFGEYEKFN